MAEFIKTIEMRNRRDIYKEGDEFLILQTDKKGREYKSSIPSFVVDYLFAQLKGKRIIREDAQEILETKAAEFNLPYHYGHQLGYYAQDVLLVLVALDKATITREGRRYIYTVQPK